MEIIKATSVSFGSDVRKTVATAMTVPATKPRMLARRGPPSSRRANSAAAEVVQPGHQLADRGHDEAGGQLVDQRLLVEVVETLAATPPQIRASPPRRRPWRGRAVYNTPTVR
jgi:hypothetical protein